MRPTLVIILLFFVSHAWAQTPIRLSNASLATLDSAVQTLGYNLFYNPEIAESFDITLSGSDPNALAQEISSAIGMQVYISGKAIIITGEFTVVDKLKGEFVNDVQNSDTIDDNLILLTTSNSSENQAATEIENQITDIGSPLDRLKSGNAVISGYLRDFETGESIIGGSVFIKSPLIGTVTDAFGYYTISLPRGEHEINVTSLGMKPAVRSIRLFGDGRLDIELTKSIISLDEVIVTGETNPVNSLRTGFSKIDIKSVQDLPTMMGEPDIMKIALNLPGVQTVGEGASGFNVRGGSVDQNLILLNDVPVFNTSHLFGFMSVFNPDAISGAELYKSGIGVHYGGRVSSVFDVGIKDGNRKRFDIRGGISPLTANLTLEGPIKKDTASYLIGARATYSDWLLNLMDDPALQKSSANFQDVIGKVNYSLNDKNDLIASGYFSNDRFRLNSDSLYHYRSGNANLQWRHKFSPTLQMTNSAFIATYDYDLTSESNPGTAFNINYGIRNYGVKSVFNYFTKSNMSIKFGLNSSYYALNPGNRQRIGDESEVLGLNLDAEQGLESALFVGAEMDINPRLLVYGGVRLSFFQSLGPGKSYTFEADQPNEPQFITDTVNHKSGEVIKNYVGPEVRLSGRYKLRDDLSVKVSFDRTYQYIHLLSNTTAVSPLDTWRLSNATIKPQIGNQISTGLYKQFYGTSLDFSVEGYYKFLNNVLDYKDGADLLLNELLVADVVSAEGQAFGIELLLKKNSGKLTGWVSYTFARSLLRTDSPYPEETINNGDFYPSNYDKPHSFVAITNYKINRRVNFSFNFNYSTGQPITFPIQQYTIEGKPLLRYTSRNQSRIPDYIRLDFAISLDGNHKVHKKFHGSWSFSVYNLLGRSNAYSVFFRTENGNVNGYKLSVFAQAVPTITYRFRLK